MLNIQILITLCQISSQSYKQFKSYEHILKFAPELAWNWETVAAEMLLILKLNLERKIS